MMSIKVKNMIFQFFAFILMICATTIFSKTMELSALEIDSSSFIKKVSNSYTNKYCNAIAFGLSKESAMKFSLEENQKVYQKKKEMKNLNKELLAEEIAISVVEKCGYPISLFGEKGIQEFKNYYLLMDNELSLKIKNE